ncbi:inorganic pyrophosphatase [Deinococcus psychrotolerans]|uniref:Inorganic pyrophosphatase n=1 Tax=Deinococcus psychrotolerans TaxID=2489213 RepID=A0A3G8YA74_9DEIO|nr:inorganic pyrophosphatase [Deinococcus psychrotolerans]AZI42065.1 inorganic pyrophosphatase [Deinococcus psychrotolerans]
MRPDLTPYLGQIVRVVVDRPLGSRHPRWPSLIYPVNSGELPQTLSGDGLPIDAYLLGWTTPLAEAQGVVVAVVVRQNDTEDKLIVARSGTVWTDAELLAAVEFQERFFVSKLVRLPS